MGSVAWPRLGGGRPSRRRSPQSPALGRVSHRSVLCESPGYPPSRAVVCSSGPSMRPVTVGHNGPAWARGAGHLGPGARGRPPDGLALTHPGANLRGHQAHPRHPRFSPEPPAWQGLATRHPPRDFPHRASRPAGAGAAHAGGLCRRLAPTTPARRWPVGMASWPPETTLHPAAPPAPLPGGPPPHPTAPLGSVCAPPGGAHGLPPVPPWCPVREARVPQRTAWGHVGISVDWC
jgi:hypothetical protein